MRRDDWREGNTLRLLENGEQFFPAVFRAIRAAREEVLVETFILFDDEVGVGLRDALLEAARNGARVELTVDGYGSFGLPPEFVRTMTDAGIQVHVVDPRPTLFGFRTNLFRRLHRKLVVVDRRIGFVGGINFSADQLVGTGEQAKLDYAVQVDGPVVDDIHGLMERALGRAPRPRPRRGLRLWGFWRRPDPPVQTGSAAAMLVVRDNDRHRNDIEWNYRLALRAARSEIVIANAYFLPGYRLLRDLRNAARRGVAVHLILQGRPDKSMARWAATTLYDRLLAAGVRIHEFLERPLHAKVAISDGMWSTVGSSNLDPTSLSLNLEANLLIRDPIFTAQLRARLFALIYHSSREMHRESLGGIPIWRQLLSVLVFHLLRWFPNWIGSFPPHRPQRVAAQDLEAAFPGDPKPASLPPMPSAPRAGP